MNSRLTHKKSRKGCLQCKRRKIKCDELSPRCTPCIKHRVSCSFGEQESFPLLESQIASPILPNQLIDLELLHNFTTNTAGTLSNRDLVNVLFRTALIDEAFRHEFLIHSVLSVSGFHMARHSDDLPKRRVYSEAAIGHYNTTIQLFRKILVEDITPSNCHAVFACSGMIFVASCAQPRLDLGFSRLLEWFTLLRGVSIIVNPSMPWVSVGPFARMVAPEQTKDLGAEMTTEYFDSHFTSLSSYFLQNSSPSDYETLKATLDLLRHTFAGQAPHEVRSLFWWPVQVSSDYMNMLAAGRPEAMVVLACYCVLLYKKDSRWWIDGWPEFMFSVVFKELNGRLSYWMKWPMETMGMLNEARNSKSEGSTNSPGSTNYIGSEVSGSPQF